MSPTDPTTLIDQVLALTEEVQQFVENGRWADASTLETERLTLLTELFARDDIAVLGPDYERLARELLSRNSVMIDTLRTQRGQLNQASQRLNAAPRAVDAYRSNTPTNEWGERRKTV